MALPIAGQTGPASSSDGAVGNLRLGRQNESIIQQLHGRYYETTFRGNMCSGANAAGVVTTVGLATTYTGLCLTNPVGSGVNAVLNKVGATALVVFPAAAILGIMAGYNPATAVTQTTPITPTNNFVGAAAGKCLLASSVTLPTAPTLRAVIAAGLTGAITVETLAKPILVDLEGSIILPPGGYAAWFTSTVSGAAGAAFSFQWEEVPITG